MRKNKQTNKQTPSPKFCIAFSLKFLLGITVVARKIEDISYAHAILFGAGEVRGQSSSIMKPCENDTKAPCRGALLGAIKDVFTPRVLFESFSFPYVPILVWSRV